MLFPTFVWWIPIPPLDGSQIIAGFIPEKNSIILKQINEYGPNILMFLIIFGMITNYSIIHAIMNPFIKLFLFLFIGNTI